MNRKELEFYRKTLMTRLEALLGTAGKTLEDLIHGGELFPDPVDRAFSESSRIIELRTRDRERKLIQKIITSLKKIEDGTYGECEECGEEISHLRLKARPEATRCIKCKQEQELLEKQFNV